MKKVLLGMAIGLSTLTFAQTIQSGGCTAQGCTYTYTSTCGTTTNFTAEGGELTLNEALIAANMYNTQNCGTSVKRVTYIATP